MNILTKRDKTSLSLWRRFIKKKKKKPNTHTHKSLRSSQFLMGDSASFSSSFRHLLRSCRGGWRIFSRLLSNLKWGPLILPPSLWDALVYVGGFGGWGAVFVAVLGEPCCQKRHVQDVPLGPSDWPLSRPLSSPPHSASAGQEVSAWRGRIAFLRRRRRSLTEGNFAGVCQRAAVFPDWIFFSFQR